MIHHLKGELLQTAPNLAVLEVSGVGFGVKTTLTTITDLPAPGTTEAAQVVLYTYLHVREDALELFGFSSQEELACYKLLISVSGVGPKAALAVLSDHSPQQFSACIAAGDTKRLTATAGIGKKTAERMVLELGDKIPGFSGNHSAGVTSSPGSAANGGLFADNVAAAMGALEALGFSPTDGARAVTSCDPSLSTEELIRLALTKLSSY